MNNVLRNYRQPSVAGPATVPAGLAGAQQAVAQRGRLLRARVPLREVGQLLGRVQPEQLQEQRRGAVEDGAELRAAGLLDQPALDQRRRSPTRRRRRGCGRPRAATPAAGRRRSTSVSAWAGVSAGRARAGEQPARGLLGVRVRGERQPPATSRSTTPAALERRPPARAARCSTASSPACSASASSSTETGSGARNSSASSVRRASVMRRASARGAPSARTVIGPNGSSCSHAASPRL